jgi:hypothetical protein
MTTSYRPVARVAVAVLGLTIAGLGAVAAPASAVSDTLAYDCSNALTGPFVATAVIDTNAPTTLGAGMTVPITTSTTVVVPAPVVDDLRDASIAFVEGTAAATGTVDGAPRQTALTVPRTNIPGPSNSMTLVGNGSSGLITGGVVGSTILIGAGDFDVTLTGYTDAGVQLTTQTVICDLQAGQPTLVDSVSVVQTTTTTTLTVESPVEYGGVVTASAEVAQSGSSAKPSGSVAFTYAGKTVTVAVKGGKAKADLPQALTMGTNHVTAVFTPTDKDKSPSQAVAPFTVVRGSTITTASAAVRIATHRVVGKALVESVNGTEVAGKVKFTLKRDGTKIRTAIVDLNAKDKAKKVFANIRKVGTYLVVAKYLGSDTLKRSKGRVKLTIM